MEEKKKPQVFPTAEQMENANLLGTHLAGINEDEVVVEDAIGNSSEVSTGELSAAEEMRRRTQEQIVLRTHAMKQTEKSVVDGKDARQKLMDEMGVVNPNAPTAAPVTAPTNEPQLAPVDVQEAKDSAMSYDEMARFQVYLESVDAKRGVNVAPPPTTPPIPPTTPPSNVGQPSGMNPPNDQTEKYIVELSQPQLNAPFDVIPLPSEGKCYPNKRKSIKVAYMTTADENILTSPNLLTSGRFLEVLINRKILDSDIKFRDLLEGDRDAIMLWLRATGYGNMYPITVNDENGEPFEVEVDLNELKTKNLNVEPDEDGLFSFTLPTNGSEIKFKLLTVGDVEDISTKVEREMNILFSPIDNTSVYNLEKQIISVNGDTNPEICNNLASNMRLLDKTKLVDYIESIICGVDMNITVGTPGGGSLDTFLPINLKFFWPNFGV